MRQLWHCIRSAMATRRGAALQAPLPSQTGATRYLWNAAASGSSSSRIAWSRSVSPIVSPLLASPLVQMEQRRAYATKLKKYKIKCYSSYKLRFREKANGEYSRRRAGKRHNAHFKTNKQLRQLRRPAVVPGAYATVMKKLNFHG